MRSLPGADRDGPAWEFFLNFARDRSGVSWNNKLGVFYLVHDPALLNKGPNVITGKLSGSPRGENGKSFRNKALQPLDAFLVSSVHKIQYV